MPAHMEEKANAARAGVAKVGVVKANAVRTPRTEPLRARHRPKGKLKAKLQKRGNAAKANAVRASAAVMPRAKASKAQTVRRALCLQTNPGGLRPSPPGTAPEGARVQCNSCERGPAP